MAEMVRIVKTPVKPVRRIADEAIEAVVQQIIEHFEPQQIILFGSYAYGQPRPDSDVDLLVVMDTPLKEVEQAVRICQAIDYHFGLDLIVYTPATLAQRITLGNPFLREAVRQGKMLYERPENKLVVRFGHESIDTSEIMFYN